jgi:hypothetical protein
MGKGGEGAIFLLMTRAIHTREKMNNDDFESYTAFPVQFFLTVVAKGVVVVYS